MHLTSIILMCMFFVVCASLFSCVESKDPAYVDRETIRRDIKIGAPDSQYVKDAYNSGLYEVQLSEHFESVLSNLDVKDIAEKMVIAHSDLNNDLKELAESKGLKLNPDLTKEQNDEIVRISTESSSNYNKIYLQKLVTDHEAAVDLFEKAAKNSIDADVKKIFDAALPEIRHHLDMARSLLNTI